MASRLSVLLYLWLCLQERAQAQEGTFLRPSLRAEPSSVVPQGTPVRLWCRGSPTAHLFTLRKAGPGGYADIYMVIPPAVGMEAEFLLSSVTASDGGLYKCCYRSPSGGSEDSEPLQLAVTGYYNRPRLSAEPSQDVAWGHNVTLRCLSVQGIDRFVLYRVEGANSSPWRDPQSHPDFLIRAVAAPHEGNYSCYEFHSQHPYAWSLPSAPLELRVTDATSQDYTKGNLIRLSLAGLILLILGVLLADAWHTGRRYQGAVLA